jgi:cellulose synthase/poly-beta-1,6-N-acetylglucosamine synthase-like glycosyltransferase
VGKLIVDVTVITVTIKGREEMLKQAAASVERQDAQPKHHWVAMDHDLIGPAMLRNDLVYKAETEWVAFLDDDDLLYPHHIETLLKTAYAEDADVVIPYCDFIGPPLPAGYCNVPFDRKTLRRHGIFPITVLAKRQSIVDHGGFDPKDRYEDWALWNRMADNNCKILVVPEVTWTYRTEHPARRTNGLNIS